MTLTELETIYKANMDVGHMAALEAVYSQGYYDGAGITVSASTPEISRSRPKPATIVKVKKPD